ncbi:hypothetical protein TWF481_009509 [Arthrobotrys musiformis]|uniref:Uncharacterized protein n=1 Tax=Arthrobotrys musiformis TaxID=47236 RepID=A0AAV9W5R3_9PEZI
MEARIYIAVFKGDPIDLTEYRHTAIVLEIDGRETMLHVKGGHGFFQYEEQTRMESVRLSRSLAPGGLIHVANISSSDANDFRSIVADTAVNNDERAWNCQNFVGDALKRVQSRHLITKEQYLGAVDEMVTIILEATDKD